MRTIAMMVLLTTTAIAQEPDEATKKWALQNAYVINNNSMVRWGDIDMSGGPPPDDKVRCVQIDGVTGQQFFECVQPNKVKTIPIIPAEPVVKWAEKNMLDVSADMPKLSTKGDGICARHKMHKVTTSDGQSWRCQK